MKKKDLKNKIESIINKLLPDNMSSEEEKTDSEINLDEPEPVSLEIEDNGRFPALTKFPKLREVIINLLTKQYDLFISNVEWVAPKPTTFRIVLANDQVFYLIYTDRSWIGKVEGKKYYLLNISEEQNCVESIARILSYGEKSVPEEPTAEAPNEEKPKSEEPVAPENAPEEPKTEEPQL